jgi:predicted amidohydrolase
MAPESARMVGLNGAEFLLLPIMGDFRADRWDMGPPVFNEDRWRTIMRAQALDNQLSMIVARNRSAGSCIVNRKGDFLAWNKGDQPFITADVPREDDYRSWNGSCFRDSAWQVRRPHLYGTFDDLSNHGNSS